MPEPKTVRIRDEIKDSNQMDERRMRQADAQILSAKLEHHLRMSVEELWTGAQRNLLRLRELAGIGGPTHDPPSLNTIAEAAADVRNYTRFIEERIGEAVPDSPAE